MDNYSCPRSLQSFLAEVRLEISVSCSDIVIGVCVWFGGQDDGVFLPLYIGKKSTPCIPFTF